MSWRLSIGTDKIVYVTFENGKSYKLDAVLQNRVNHIAADDLRARYFQRNKWWRGYVHSMDDGAKELPKDYGDAGRSVNRMIREMDRPYRGPEVPKCVKAKRAAFKIARKLGLVHARNVERFIAAIWENGKSRRLLTMANFGLCERSYFYRLERYLAILGWGCGTC